MIPRIIHYCWFGRGDKPPEVARFIDGWRRLHPDFRVIEWNEDNFDIGCCRYVREAYARRQFAFVSDYARGLALLSMGGVYLDTDVELLGRLDGLLDSEGFIGFEYGNSIATSTMGFRPGHPLMRRYLEEYQERAFVRADGSLDTTTNVIVLTRLATEFGLKLNGTAQVISSGVVCLPMQVLSPLDYVNLIDHRDSSTLAVHHYQHSWGGPLVHLRKRLMRGVATIFGPKVLGWIRSKLSHAQTARPPTQP